MKGFKGVAKYQDYCRMAVKRDKYILLNPVTGHRFFIWDLDKLIAVEDGSDRSSESLDYYDKRISELEKCSINYRIQNRGACTFKLASILFFNYLKRNNLLGTVKYCLAVHDEVDLEAPEAMKDEIAAKLIKCMENGAKPFCTKLHLSADVSIGDYWIH